MRKEEALFFQIAGETGLFYVQWKSEDRLLLS